MDIWWDSLSKFQQVLFIIATSTTLIMLLQVIMMLVGSGDDPSFDADTDLDASDGGDGSINETSFGMIFGLRVLTMRSALAFASIASWTMFLLVELLPNLIWLDVIIGLLAGAGAAVLVAYVLKLLEGLQSSGNLEIENAVGKTGEVYLTIPAARAGSGKVNVLVQERLSEFEAITDNADELKTGTRIAVKSIVGNSTLLVDKE